MRLTAKGRYAVTAILDLAMYGSVEPVVLADISKRQIISLSYLEQLFAQMRKHGLVTSTRGPGGGYTLNKAAKDISVAQVIAAVDEMIEATGCSGASNCKGGARCLTHGLWTDLGHQIRCFLDNISLQDLMEREDIRGMSELQSEISIKPGNLNDGVFA